MKKHIKLFTYFLLVALTSSKCKKEEIVKSPPYNPYFKQWVLDTLWTQEIGFSINPIINSNNDVLVNSMFTDKGPVFKLFDGITGKLKWEWYDYFKPEEGFLHSQFVLYKDILVLGESNNTYAFNTVTGQTLWKNHFDTMIAEPQIHTDEAGNIFQGFRNENQFSTYSILSTKYNENNWNIICTYSDTINFDKMYCENIGFSKNTKGEKIMVFTLYLNYKLNGANKISIRACGFNLETNQYEWKKDYTDKYYEFARVRMKSASGNVYTFGNYSGKWYIVAINSSNGEISWDRVIPDFGVSMHLYKDNIVVLSNNSSPVLCLNQKTGAIYWQQNFTSINIADLNFAFGDAKVYKNYLLSTQCQKLLALNLDNGNIVFNNQVALPYGCIENGLAINEQKHWFYVGDGRNVVCYKLPENIR